MKGKKIPIKYSKERVVLSDVLPHETPIIFSNRHFYRFLIKKKKIEQLKNNQQKSQDIILQKKVEDFNKKNKGFGIALDLLFGKGETQPFIFHISHKENDIRTLSLIHPRNQQKVVDFYEKYKDLILYYCSVSPFSIRKPANIATFVYHKDYLHSQKKADDIDTAKAEQDDYEYESLKSFFTYESCNYIYKFFESYMFHRSEKKYNKLQKIDIAKCFDSIYTHTIVWAVFNKSIVKNNIKGTRKTFAGEFDYLMQKLNANETNGIVIGPEFSRIFAEIILQQVDRDIFDSLAKSNKKPNGLVHKVDYEIFRYIDDYFIFFNDDEDADCILKEIKLALKNYKMYINMEKSVVYEKPIITEITMAKEKISALFKNYLNIVVKNNEMISLNNEEEYEEEAMEENSRTSKYIYISSNVVITKFKAIIREIGIDYKDIMNYSLSSIEKKAITLIKSFYKLKKEDLSINLKKQFEGALLSLLDTAFFLYSVAPRVNGTIIVCRIISLIVDFLKGKHPSANYEKPFAENDKHTILKKIADEIFLVLQKYKNNEVTQVENLYLLIALSELGREYRLSPKSLCAYFNAEIDDTGEVEFNAPLNYFAITTLLFYIKDIKMYIPIKKALKTYVQMKIAQVSHEDWRRNTEIILLVFDIMSCPFIDGIMNDREKLLLKAKLGELQDAIMKPIDNLNEYQAQIKKSLNCIYALDIELKLKKSILNKISTNINKYLCSLLSHFGKRCHFKSVVSDFYKCEQNAINCILDLVENLEEHLDPYRYKKKILGSLKISNSSMEVFIKQEKYWFIQWTNFNFGEALNSKKGQEVY